MPNHQLIIFDPLTGRITQAFLNGGFSTPDYAMRKDVIFDPAGIDDLIRREVPMQYWIVDIQNYAVQEMSDIQKDMLNQEQLDARILAEKPGKDLRSSVQNILGAPTDPLIKDFANAVLAYLIPGG